MGNELYGPGDNNYGRDKTIKEIFDSLTPEQKEEIKKNFINKMKEVKEFSKEFEKSLRIDSKLLLERIGNKI